MHTCIYTLILSFNENVYPKLSKLPSHIYKIGFYAFFIGLDFWLYFSWIKMEENNLDWLNAFVVISGIFFPFIVLVLVTQIILQIIKNEDKKYIDRVYDSKIAGLMMNKYIAEASENDIYILMDKFYQHKEAVETNKSDYLSIMMPYPDGIGHPFKPMEVIEPEMLSPEDLAFLRELYPEYSKNESN